MKIKPVLDALERSGADTVFVHTGQHYDPEMSQVFLDELGIRAPDHALGVGSGSHATQTARVMTAFEELLDREPVDVVVVVGDVNSTLACAIVAAKAVIPVAHVEAGLRSRDWTMPEEVNRVATDSISHYLLAPSPDAVANLEQEGRSPAQIHLVGNVMVDTLLANLDRAQAMDTHDRLGVERGEYGLVTLHRPANVDDPAVLEDLAAALRTIADRLPLVFPVHPRTRQRLADLAPIDGLTLVEPQGYLDFIALEANAALVLTDSGGVQEETTVLGVPCLTLRENTERPITVDQGTNRVVGRDRDVIVEAAWDVLENGVEPRRPALWDGRAGERIAQVITRS